MKEVKIPIRKLQSISKEVAKRREHMVMAFPLTMKPNAQENKTKEKNSSSGGSGGDGNGSDGNGSSSNNNITEELRKVRVSI